MLRFAQQQVRAAWHQNVVTSADPLETKQMIEPQSHQEMILHGGVDPGPERVDGMMQIGRLFDGRHSLCTSTRALSPNLPAFSFSDTITGMLLPWIGPACK